MTTNFGRTFIIGHDYPLQVDPVCNSGGYGIGIKNLEEKKFDLEIPPCSKVVCFHGSFNANLLSIAAYFG